MFKKILFTITIILILLNSGIAQIIISSPYSRYGIGDLQNNKYLRNISMGGISYGFRNSNGVNYINPASYTAFDTNSFVFETGVNSQFFQLYTTDFSQFSNYTSLAYLVFGFPVTKWWGASMGLLPFSSVGYKISNFVTQPDLGRLNYQYEGTGGLNQFYIGNAFRIKNVSLGFNAAYIFGSLGRQTIVDSLGSTTYLDMQLNNSTLVRDILLTFGLQYQTKLSKDMTLCIGGIYNFTSKLKAEEDSLAFTYKSNSDGTIHNVKDTIVNSNNTKGKLVLPQNIGAGITIGKSGSWLVGVDYQMQRWKDYSLLGEKDSLKNSWMLSVGAEITPKNTAVSGYWRRIHYRIGARYNQTYLQLRNTQLSEYAVSAGLGLPLKRLRTTLNLGFEAGQRGTTENNLIKEQFCRVILSLSLYENWFIKHRFD